MQEKQKNHVTLTMIFNRVQEIVKVHVHAKPHQAKCSGSQVIKFWRCWKQYCHCFRRK